ncbi:hypothetical protein B0T26DRAFT_729818 [Lasiosphaeria miniovina]|uniref:Uncharacterized protein n=1 Tax=Lasiosphaeria miniovina TaxID=1954250 RepID=A0AA39ZSW9_9PEZI|nr:uncharacterized protein B0T26DRAFT_729818 [Lasiosphaeria miniovina]KAK0703096.1 hypothetical protein B0T26DRAFT_729818 [Lasiosphaeria miniovina]
MPSKPTRSLRSNRSLETRKLTLGGNTVPPPGEHVKCYQMFSDIIKRGRWVTCRNGPGS